MRSATESNPYRQGNFAPVAREQTLPTLRVSGQLPKDLCGTLLRNGPNPVGTPSDKDHWFTGDAMLHAIEIADGGARGYRNRYVRTPHVETELGFQAAPRSAHPYPIQGSGNVNVISHAGHILALPEVGLPYEMNRALETRGEYDFKGALQSSMTAHPKIDPVSGGLLMFGYDFGPTYLRYHRVGQDGTLDRTIEIAKPCSTMMHDFGVTQTRVVFMDLPVVFDLRLIEQGYTMPFRWDASFQARLGVLSRDATTDATRWINIDPCYVYHVLNSYDDGARIIMDVIRYERVFDKSRIGPMEDKPGKLVRWAIDVDAGVVKETVLDITPQEFPRVDPRRETLPHRYGYAVEANGGPNQIAFQGLLKHDLKMATTQRHDVGPRRSAGEGVFVPSGPGEDQGYLIAPVYNAETNTSDVVVLDAQNFAGAPLATIHLPVRIPFGFHGNFV
jgi:carotenoid cleavage dioxygenase